MNEPVTTIIGNLADAPEMRFTQGDKAVCSFRVANTPRTRNAKGEWEDGEPLWMSCSAWEKLAENIVASDLKRGDQVIVMGILRQRNYEKDGQKRSVIEMTVNAIGPSLQWATATPTKVKSGGSSNGGERRQAPANAEQQRTAQKTSAPAASSAVDDDPPW